MENNFWFNGSLLSVQDCVVPPQTRASRFGDGVFETIRILQGKPLFWDDHYQRFRDGLQVLGISLAKLPQPGEMSGMVRELLGKDPSAQSGRLRLTGYRQGEGLDRPETNHLDWMMVYRSQESPGALEGETACLSFDYRILPSRLSRIKSLNRLPYVMAAREAAERGVGTAVLLNPEGAVADAVSSNLFCVVTPEKIITPPVSDGALPGIMRSKLLSLLPEWGFSVEEARVYPEQFPDFQEVWCTNVIRGVQPVKSILMDARVDYSVILGRQVQERLGEYLMALNE